MSEQCAVGRAMKDISKPPCVGRGVFFADFHFQGKFFGYFFGLLNIDNINLMSILPYFHVFFFIFFGQI